MLTTQDKSQQILELYRSVCHFNYHRDLDSKRHAQLNLQLDELPRSKSQDFQHVPLSFPSTDSYINFWRPLFIEELKGYITSARGTESQNPQKFDLQSYFELGSFKVMQFKRVRASQVSYTPNSLILLSPEKKLDQSEESPHMVGIVYKYDSTLFVRVLLGEGQSRQGTQNWTLFTTTKQWYLQEVCTLGSVDRQYKALCRFGKIEPYIRNILLNPQQYKEEACKRFTIPTQLDKQLVKIYNPSQYQAITSTLKQEGVTLIQGPPGTGKTKTVLGTLSVLLQSSTSKEQDQQLPLLMRWKTSQEDIKSNILEINPWLKEEYHDWRDEPFLSNQHQQLTLTRSYQTTDRTIHLQSRAEDVRAPAKVLVCGPSNASVDQVIRKLVKQKLLDGKGKPYLPRFVRVGEHYHQSLQEHSLDAMSMKVQKVNKIDIGLAKKKVLKDSQLVFSTLSSSGSAVLENAEIEFDTVVIDEAGQAVQISSLIPLLYGCRRLILIGDPKQLPATVFSPICLQHHYEQSLFERLMRSNYPISLLKIQYRMHPDISSIVASSFYQGLLQNGSDMVIQPKATPNSFMMLHVDSSCQLFGQQSFYNPIEGECVKIVVNFLAKHYKDIGVLSPYSAQVKWLINSQAIPAEIKTIDSFQGREKEVVVFSAVRASKAGKDNKANPRRTIGFVADGRRLNVALSRAREVCIVVGDLDRLQTNKTWRGIITESRRRQCAFKVINGQELRQMGLSSLRKY